MHDGLAGCCTTIHPYVVAVGLLCLFDNLFGFYDCQRKVLLLAWVELKKIGDRAFADNQQVPGRYRKAVFNDKEMAVLK